ncbi:hypothetical protein SDC9_07473 [bioreactor metagenome]|uniref:Uncharacterized protein n=1 Tax=bioreactor metagenome TaxID=1076179 RepID=A0A644T4Z4_9ZZZZ
MYENIVNKTEKEDGFTYFLAKGIGKAKDITKEGI